MEKEQGLNKGSRADCNLSQHNEAQEREKADRQAISAHMDQIKHKILILSGKGGVGKSTVAVNLAVSLVLAGKKVGLLDIDIHGPSIPGMLHLTKERPLFRNDLMVPVRYDENLKVMSIGFLLEEKDAAVIWRGPLKMQMIKQFLKDVDWGELDYLIVDSPPGTGDEPLSIAQLIPRTDGAVIVTTPQQISVADVRRCVNFCRKVSVKILGVVENMSGFICPTCGSKVNIFRSGGGLKMANDMRLPFLGSVPIDPSIAEACDNGEPYLQYYTKTETAGAFQKIVDKLTAKDSGQEEQRQMMHKDDKRVLRIALPVAAGKLCPHFGHCESFALFDVQEENKAIVKMTQLPSPGHQPGILPVWLREHNVDVVIAGGLGSRAQELMVRAGIKPVTGALEDTPEHIIQSYLEGTLAASENMCDH